MAKIHASAIVDPKAELDSSVEVGAYSIVGPNVRIGAGTVIGPHVVVDGHTTIGRDNRFYQFSSIGGAPQDKKYAGEPTQLIVGDRNMVREFCTLNTGTVQDEGITRIGDDNWFMAYVHIAHDCQVGSKTIIANSTSLAGHVHVGDWAILGGLVGVHQFCKIGAHAMVGAKTYLSQDVPPFTMVTGNPAAPHGINVEGLRRRGFTPPQVSALRNAYRVIYKSGMTLEQAKAELESESAASEEAREHLNQLRTFLEGATRGIVR